MLGSIRKGIIDKVSKCPAGCMAPPGRSREEATVLHKWVAGLWQGLCPPVTSSSFVTVLCDSCMLARWLLKLGVAGTHRSRTAVRTSIQGDTDDMVSLSKPAAGEGGTCHQVSRSRAGGTQTCAPYITTRGPVCKAALESWEDGAGCCFACSCPGPGGQPPQVLCHAEICCFA